MSQGFLDGLGIRPVLGRSIESGPPTAAVAADPHPQPLMISHRLWRDRFGLDPAAIGREFDAEVESRNRSVARFRVEGILPEGFWFGADSRDLMDVLLPLRTLPRVYRVRLRDGVPPGVAAARITAAVRQHSSNVPAHWPGVTLQSAQDRYAAPVRPALRAAAMANVIGLTLGALTVLASFALAFSLLGLYASTAFAVQQRRREIALRAAFGATERALVCLLLWDSGLVLAAGVTAGIVVALVVSRMLASQMFGVGWFDLSTLAGASVMLVAAGLIAAWRPAHRATRASLVAALTES